MFRLFTLLSFVALAASQGYQHDSKNAAIISEQRYLSGDGKHGAAYSQEDGINFKEETDADGTRHGSYSYVDPTGQRRTISYTAGKNGFQASGDHLPVPPPAPPQVAPTAGYTPQAQYQPPQYQAPQQYSAPQPAATAYDGSENFDDGSYDPRYNDPSFSEQQQQRPYQAPAPQPAAYSPPAAAPQYQPQYQHYSQPQQQAAYYPEPTQNPHRFSPPGKLSLNRTPDGFTYSFNKV